MFITSIRVRKRGEAKMLAYNFSYAQTAGVLTVIFLILVILGIII